MSSCSPRRQWNGDVVGALILVYMLCLRAADELNN